MKPYEVIPGTVNKAWELIQREFDQVYTRKQLREAIKKSEEIVKEVQIQEVGDERRVRIGIVGEIYVVMEPSINMEIENVLGELGCEVERSHYLSEWVRYNMVPNFLGKSHEEEILKKGNHLLKSR